MSEKRIKYKFPDKSKAAAEPEKQVKQFVLVWHSSITLERQIYYPGDLVSEEIVNKMPKFLKIHFWEVGKELPPHVFRKLAKNLQKYFTEIF
jgi:hypothetical protein